MSGIILASRSPRRLKLLEQAGLRFKVVPSTIEEPPCPKNLDPKAYALLLAKAKAEDIAAKTSDSLIIAADTIVVCERQIYGKPADRRHAVKMLKALSGKKQYVYTALAVIDQKSGRIILDIEKTTILAKKLSNKTISELSKTNHDKAGAYAVQKDSDILVKKIIGDYYNVVGMPVKRLKAILGLFKIVMKSL